MKYILNLRVNKFGTGFILLGLKQQLASGNQKHYFHF